MELYHLSFQQGLEGVWTPQPPAGTELNQKGKYTETARDRISVSPSIEQCFFAVYPNVSKYVEELKYPYLEFWVYSPVNLSHAKVVTPEEYTRDRQIWDAHVTEEHGILTPTRFVCLGKVRITVLKTRTPGVHTHPYNDPKEPLKYVGPKDIKVEWVKKTKLPVSVEW